MKSIIVVSRDEDAYGRIAAAFKPDCAIERAAQKEVALDLMQKRRFDHVFIDLNALDNNEINSRRSSAGA